MQRIWFNDPDYIANIDSLKAAGKTVSKSQRPRTPHFYFCLLYTSSPRRIEMASSCVGSSTITFWNRRSRALSCSNYF